MVLGRNGKELAANYVFGPFVLLSSWWGVGRVHGRLCFSEEGKPLGSVEAEGGWRRPAPLLRMGERLFDPGAPRGTASVLLRRRPGVPNLGIGLAGQSLSDIYLRFLNPR